MNDEGIAEKNQQIMQHLPLQLPSNEPQNNILHWYK